MNDRQDIREQLSAYIDGELPAQQARLVEQALAEDQLLQQELKQLQAVRAALRNLPVERAGEEFAARVLGAAERAHLMGGQVHRHRGTPRWAKLAAAAACLALLAVGARVLVPAFDLDDDFEHRHEKLAMDDQDTQDSPLGVDESPIACLEAAPPARPTEDASYRGLCLADGPSEFRAAGSASDGYAFDADALAALSLAGANSLRYSLPQNSVNETIFTQNLLASQRDVEGVLLGNGVLPQPVAVNKAQSLDNNLQVQQVGNSHKQLDQSESQRGMFLANSVSHDQVQIVALVDARQADAIRRQIREVVQNQSQSASNVQLQIADGQLRRETEVGGLGLEAGDSRAAARGDAASSEVHKDARTSGELICSNGGVAGTPTTAPQDIVAAKEGVQKAASGQPVPASPLAPGASSSGQALGRWKVEPTSSPASALSGENQMQRQAIIITLNRRLVHKAPPSAEWADQSPPASQPAEDRW